MIKKIEGPNAEERAFLSVQEEEGYEEVWERAQYSQAGCAPTRICAISVVVAITVIVGIIVWCL